MLLTLEGAVIWLCVEEGVLGPGCKVGVGFRLTEDAGDGVGSLSFCMALRYD